MMRLKAGLFATALLFTVTACNDRLKTEDAALIAAARTGHAGTVRDMIASGAKVNATDERGNTGLIEAARNGHDDVVRTLLAAGADVKVRNDDGKTALMLAVLGGHEETAQVLRLSGAVE